MSENNDLNKLKVVNEDTSERWSKKKNYSTGAINADVKVMFRNKRQKLIEFINRYLGILDAFAWCTDFQIVNSLQEKMVSTILQKRRFFVIG